MTATLKPSRLDQRYTLTAAIVPQEVTEFRFSTTLKASAAVAWGDTTRAMHEHEYKPQEGKRYRVLFISHTDMVNIAQMPSCMNEAISGIADALEVDRLALLIGYQWGVVDGRGVEVVVEEVQS